MFCSFCPFLLILWIEKQLNLVVPEKGRPVAHSGEKEEIDKPGGSRKGGGLRFTISTYVNRGTDSS